MRIRWKAGLWILVLILLCVPEGFAWTWPDTGQTKCYDNTVEIPCPEPGQPFYGQDAQYQGPTRSYTKLGQNGEVLADSATQESGWVMTRDNVTGLIWEIKRNNDGVKNYSDPRDADNTYTWYDSNPATNGGYAGTPGDGTDTEDFIAALNATNFGGFSDWRLPTIKDLSSLVNSSVPYPGPTIDSAWFPGTVSSYYWSSTNFYVGGIDFAWFVYFLNGGVRYHGKTNSYYVRAVRGSSAMAALTDNGDGTVTDTITGLMWQKATAPGTYTWQNALAHCEDSTFAGYTDWRLPDRNELQSIVDYSRYNPAIDPLLVTDITQPEYLSSTSNASSTGRNSTWNVRFSYGDINATSKTDSYYVRAVRGGLPINLSDMFGQPIGAPRQISLFGNTYSVVAFSKDLDPDKTVYLPFYGYNQDAATLVKIENLITDFSLAKAVLTYDASLMFYGDITADDHGLYREIVEFKNHYQLDKWYNNVLNVVSPVAGMMISKRKHDRTVFGNLSFFLGQEAGKARLTKGSSLMSAGPYVSFFNELYRSNRVQVVQEEIQNITLANMIYGENVSSILGLAGLPDLTDLYRIAYIANKAQVIDKILYENMVIAASQGNMEAFKIDKNQLIKGFKNLFIGVAFDISADLVSRFVGFGGEEGVKEQGKVFAWLHDVHCDAIYETSKRLLKERDEIKQLISAPSTLENHNQLTDKIDNFFNHHAILLRPLVTELMYVQWSHLEEINNSSIPSITKRWTIGWNYQDIINEQRQIYDNALGSENIDKNKYLNFLYEYFQRLTTYEGALKAISSIDSDSYLNIISEQVNRVYIGQTTNINISITNNYPLDVTNLNMEAGTVQDILYSSSIPSTIASTVTSNSAIEINVPANWFTYHDLEAQVITLPINITWTVGSKAYAKVFSIKVTVVSPGAFTQAAPNKNIFYPGEPVEININYENAGASTSPTLFSYLLRSDGEKESFTFSPSTNGQGTIQFIAPNEHFGAYGIQLYLYDAATSNVLIPMSYFNRVFYLVPSISADISLLDPANTLIIYRSDDEEAAKDLQTTLGMPATSLIKIDLYSTSQLINYASGKDTILVGGREANPLVDTLINQGKLTSSLIINGDMQIERVGNAFGNKASWVIAGYNLRDTAIACVGFMGKWSQYNGFFLKGDINGNGVIDLADTILCLQILTGNNISKYYTASAEVNRDSKIGIAEAIYILQKLAGLRQ